MDIKKEISRSLIKAIYEGDNANTYRLAVALERQFSNEEKEQDKELSLAKEKAIGEKAVKEYKDSLEKTTTEKLGEIKQ